MTDYRHEEIETDHLIDLRDVVVDLRYECALDALIALCRSCGVASIKAALLEIEKSMTVARPISEMEIKATLERVHQYVASIGQPNYPVRVDDETIREYPITMS